MLLTLFDKKAFLTKLVLKGLLGMLGIVFFYINFSVFIIAILNMNQIKKNNAFLRTLINYS